MPRRCSQCYQVKPDQDFVSPRSPHTPTKGCAECRTKAAQSMKLHHERRRLGIVPPRGRPAESDLIHPIALTLRIPRAILGEVEEWVKNRVDIWLKANGGLPAGETFGVAAAPPRAAAKGAKRVSRSSSTGPITEDHAIFLANCTPLRADQLQSASRINFDLEYNQWLKANRPKDWAGKRKHGQKVDSA